LPTIKPVCRAYGTIKSCLPAASNSCAPCSEPSRMLKKSLMTPPPIPARRDAPFTKFVLASLRGSTYGLGKRLLLQAMGGRVKIVYASPQRHWALTDSRPSANVTLIILRVADLAAALPAERRVLARRGWAGETVGLFEHPAGCSGTIHDGLPWRR
jgi:hypothetical protein